jgi:hypothetical protein
MPNANQTEGAQAQIPPEAAAQKLPDRPGYYTEGCIMDTSVFKASNMFIRPDSFGIGGITHFESSGGSRVKHSAW